ncbi:MAG: NifB/NifX family molybdenum-iron cluster-binding protein [Oscillospiraceae bacterium]|nr:NifB/NifX family molybdenum-iron cluster-binding protein [Oscillospiraceae bacterium]
MAKKLVINHQMTFIAVACGEEILVTNFEQTQTFWTFYLDGKKLKKEQFLSLQAKTTSELIDQFCGSMFDVIIAKNFGPKAIHSLKEKGKRLYTFDGGKRAALNAYLNGELREL